MNDGNRERCVVFDAGGTLLDLEYRYLREALSEGVAAAPAGAPSILPPDIPTDAEFERGERAAREWFIERMRVGAVSPQMESAHPHGPEAWNGYFERVFGGAGVPRDRTLDLLGPLWRRNLADGLWHRPVPGSTAALASLRDRGVRMAVVSNAEGRVADDLRKAGLETYFETIVDSSKVGVAKPDPRIFAFALEALGIGPERAVYVGDFYGVDVVGARSAGMQAVLLDRWGLQRDVDCPRIESLADLEGALETLS